MDTAKKHRQLNLFDVLFVLLILIFVIVAYMLSHGGISRQETITRNYLLELADLPDGMQDSVSIGCQVEDNVKNYELGIVTAIEIIPSTGSVLDEETRTIQQAVKPDQLTLLLTIQVDTVETEDTSDTVSGYPLRVGRFVSCTAGSLTASGYILAVDREGAAN